MWIGRPLLNLAIKGVIVPALIDTGATRSLLRLDVFRSIQKSTHSPFLLQPMTGLKIVTGESIEVIGKTEIAIAHVGPVTVVVCKQIAHQFIIGNDLLQNGKAKIDYQRGEVTWHNQKWPTRYRQSSGIAGIDDTVIDTGYDDIDTVIKHYEGIFCGKHDVNGKCDIRPI